MHAENFIWALTDHERVRNRAILDAVTISDAGLSKPDVAHMMSGCDLADYNLSELNLKGFWRAEKELRPELRHTILTLIAHHDLESKIQAANGDRQKGIEIFLDQNHGEGWMLPETLRLADYGLGHDDRAQHPQPVASRLGPRFYDWQLVQTADESWRECHLHARNLLGADGYASLAVDGDNRPSNERTTLPEEPVSRAAESITRYRSSPRPNKPSQANLFK